MELFHFSEDPSIEVFEPHVATTAQRPEALVWAIDAEHAPLYWFPRQCPRITFWRTPSMPAPLEERLFSATEATRVHLTELRWLEEMRSSELFAYRFDADRFEHLGDGHWTSRTTVSPLGVEPTGDLLALHASAGIELRFVPSLIPMQRTLAEEHAVHPGIGHWFSMVRMRNAMSQA